MRELGTCRWHQSGSQEGSALQRARSPSVGFPVDQLFASSHPLLTVSRMKNSERSRAPERKADLGQDCTLDQP